MEVSLKLFGCVEKLVEDAVGSVVGGCRYLEERQRWGELVAWWGVRWPAHVTFF